MKRWDNYSIQAQAAMQYFLGYDHGKLIQKLKLSHNPEFLFTRMLGKSYRISRCTGQIQRFDQDWQDVHSYNEIMTLLDLVCDSREDRFLTLRWKSMEAFGQMFHRNLLENETDPFAEKIQADTRAFIAACAGLDAQPGPGGDLSFAIELFDGLRIAVQFWEGDDEFPPRVRFLWDENARMYLKYETMYFAVGMLKGRITELMESRQQR